MVIIFAVLGYQIITLHRQNLEESTYAAGDRITDIVKRSTRFGMLHNRSDEIDEIVSSIGSQPGIETIRIFNRLASSGFPPMPGKSQQESIRTQRLVMRVTFRAPIACS
jgi:histidine kinase